MLTSILVNLRLPTPGIAAPSAIGDKVHGLFYDLIERVDAALATTVHDTDRIKPFTCGDLQGPMRSEDGVLTLVGERYSLRFCALTETVGNALSRALFSRYAEKTPLALGSLAFIPTRVIMSSDDIYWARSATYNALAQTPPRKRIGLHLRTPTLFMKRKKVGYDTMPTARNLFGSALRRWNDLCPRLQLPSEEVLAGCDLLCADLLELTTQVADLGDTTYRGAVGKLTFTVEGQATPLQRQAFTTLAEFMYYAGIGFGTTRGLGQVGVTS